MFGIYQVMMIYWVLMGLEDIEFTNEVSLTKKIQMGKMMQYARWRWQLNGCLGNIPCTMWFCMIAVIIITETGSLRDGCKAVPVISRDDSGCLN